MECAHEAEAPIALQSPARNERSGTPFASFGTQEERPMRYKAYIAGLVFGFCAAQSYAAQSPATISMMNTNGKEIGQASITDGPNGIVVSLSLREKPEGIPPGAHGFHIHGVGKCEPPFKSAGDHFAPQKSHHGFLSKGGRHGGDMPNIHVPESGQLKVEFFVPGVRLSEGKNALLDKDGAALVIHAQPDDYKTDPSGNAGDRMACGAIQAAGKSAQTK
jgi:Cu-Zn family superoxide dismutase